MNTPTANCCEEAKEMMWWLSPGYMGPEKEGWSMVGGMDNAGAEWYYNINFCPFCGEDLRKSGD